MSFRDFFEMSGINMSFRDFFEMNSFYNNTLLNGKFLGYHCAHSTQPEGHIRWLNGIQQFMQRVMYLLPEELKNKAKKEGLIGTSQDRLYRPHAEYLVLNGELDDDEADEYEQDDIADYEVAKQWGDKCADFLNSNDIREMYISGLQPGGAQGAFYGNYCFKVYAPSNYMALLLDPYEEEARILYYYKNNPPKLVSCKAPVWRNTNLIVPNQPEKPNQSKEVVVDDKFGDTSEKGVF